MESIFDAIASQMPSLSALTAVPEGVSSPLAWLGLAFALGLVHAFDADHVMAVSVLSTDTEADSAGENRSKRFGAGLGAGLRWSFGHGLVLVATGVGLLVLGWSMPAAWVTNAERFVGGTMILLGASALVGLLRRRSHLHFHEHDGLRPHAHWHSHEDAPAHPPRNHHHHEHTASVMGAVHGLAGSAPILALLPAAARSPLLGIAYLVIFGIGVAIAMACVSGLLGQVAEQLSRRAQSTGLLVLRGLSATGSVALGTWLALQS